MSKRSDPQTFARALTATPDPLNLTADLAPAPQAEGAGALAVQPPDPALPVTQAELDAHGFDPADYEWLAVPRQRRSDGWTHERQRRFIGALADTGSVAEAARTVNMSVQSAYRLRRAPGGEPFGRAWDAAIAQAGKALLDIAMERVIFGMDEPVLDKAGRRIAGRRRFSDPMLQFLLRGFFPDRFGHIGARRGVERSAPAMPELPVEQALAALGPATPAEPHRLMPPEELRNWLADEVVDREEEARFAAEYPEAAAKWQEEPEIAPNGKWSPFAPAIDQSRLDPKPAAPSESNSFDDEFDRRLAEARAEEAAALRRKRTRKRDKAATP